MTDFRSIRLPEGSKVEMTIDAKPLLRIVADKIRSRADMQRRLIVDEEKRTAAKRDLAAVLDTIAMRAADGEIPDALLAYLFDAIDPPSSSFRWRPGESAPEEEGAKLRRIFGIPDEAAASGRTVTVRFD